MITTPETKTTFSFEDIAALKSDAFDRVHYLTKRISAINDAIAAVDAFLILAMDERSTDDLQAVVGAARILSDVLGKDSE